MSEKEPITWLLPGAMIINQMSTHKSNLKVQKIAVDFIMPNFTFVEYADMHLMYGLASGNASEAARLYAERFPDRYLPDRRTIERVDRNLRESGLLCLAFSNCVLIIGYLLGSLIPKPGGVGRPRTARTIEMEENILDLITNDPTNSVRKLAAPLHTCKSLVHRVLQEQLLHPYHFQKVHSMSPDDYPARVEFANWFLQKQREDNTFVSKVLFTDESGFSRDGVINSHNLHLWDEDNPHAIIQTKNQHKFLINVWMGIIGNYLIGPYVIDGRLNGEKYLQFLRDDLNNLLEEVPLHIRNNIWLMHDGAPPHFSNIARGYLDNQFPNRWIGRGGPFPWPPRSPDLNPLDFFLWGHLKYLVYSTPVQTREELLERIFFHCAEIRNNPGMLFRVQRAFLTNLRKCITVQGAHIEHIP